MPGDSWVQTLIASQADGTALTASTTETSLLPTSAGLFLESGAANTLGNAFEFWAMGRASTVVTTPGTLTFRIKFGGTGASGSAVSNSGAIALTTTAQTNDTWTLRGHLLVRTTGAAASCMYWGQFTSGILNNSITSPADFLFPPTAPAVGATFDSRASQQVDLTAQWSISNANSILCHAFIFKSLN